MPRPLLARLNPDSIAEFRAAALERFRDGEAAAALDRRTAAIYLWGYAAEMIVKAAYFSLAQYPMDQPITFADLASAKLIATRQHQITWLNPSNYHNIVAWAELLTKVRASSPKTRYPDPYFGVEVLGACFEVQRSWTEQLRYHKNVAYRHELIRVKAAAEWLLLRSFSL